MPPESHGNPSVNTHTSLRHYFIFLSQATLQRHYSTAVGPPSCFSLSSSSFFRSVTVSSDPVPVVFHNQHQQPLRVTHTHKHHAHQPHSSPPSFSPARFPANPIPASSLRPAGPRSGAADQGARVVCEPPCMINTTTHNLLSFSTPHRIRVRVQRRSLLSPTFLPVLSALSLISHSSLFVLYRSGDSSL